MKKVLFVFAAFVFCFQATGFCQNGGDVLTNAVSKLKAFLSSNVAEKAYLHFDHPYPYYTAGEIVYFKAYVTMGELHQPSTISNVLHVDLIGRGDTIMQSISVYMNNGTGWGDFDLPETLRKGTYRIRAYTDWMRNEKHPVFFDQYISVSSANSGYKIAEPAKTGNQPSLQFFPEGGNLVDEIHSKVAFKAVGPDGLGMNFSGVVVDNENKEIAKITTSHLGMGEFDFTPETGKSYTAKVTFANGLKSVIGLPPSEQKGITLSVTNDDPGKVSIEIKANRPYFKENLNKELNLIIYWGGSARTVKTKLDNAVLGLDLPASTFRTGILQVILLSQTGEGLNERLAFIQNNDLLNIDVNTNKPQFAKRENVSLNLKARNKDGNPVAGSFSVSVVDESKILTDEDNGNSLLSCLLLTSDVKGYVEKPNYYFANISLETRRNLDILMLVQGYRRFVWKEILNDNNTSDAGSFKPEKSLKITGTLKTKTGKPIADCKLTLIPEVGGQTSTSATDEQGKFKFENLLFETGARFILKAQSSVGKNAVLTVDNPLLGPVIDNTNTVDAQYNANADLLMSPQISQNQGLITADVGNTTVKLASREDNLLKNINDKSYRSSNLGGPGHADQVIKGDQIKNLPTLSSGLDGIAVGVHFVAGVPYMPTSQIVSATGQSAEPMLVVVDGSSIGTGVNIDLYNPNDVETIEILRGNNAAIYGIDGGAGVIVITTRQGGERDEIISNEMSPGIFSIEPKGFYKAREFYSPHYSPDQFLGNASGQHTTVFWKPDATTNADGNASFNFFNTDAAGTYRIVVEGMDNNGNLGRRVYRYKVE